MDKITRYFKRPWDDTTGAPLTDDWGTSVFYFETNLTGEVLRQLEVFANGKRIKYTTDYLEDEYGGLSEVPLDLVEFKGYEIAKDEFEEAWLQ